MDRKNKGRYVEIVPFYPVEVLKTEDYFLYPAEVMKENGYSAEIFAFRGKRENRYDIVNGIPVRYFDTPLHLYRSLPGNAILHCHGLTRQILVIYFLLFLFKKKMKKVITPHTSFGIYPPFASKIKIHKLCKFIFNSFNAIITLSAYEKEFYLRNGFRNIYEVGLAIDYSFFSQLKENNFKDEYFKKKYDIKEGTSVFLFIGGDRDIKNPRAVIAAFNSLRVEKNDCKLFIIGCSDDMSIANLNNLVKEQYRNDVFFLKRINPYSEIYSDIFKASDIFINSSMNEGFPLGVGEAASCGMALCLSDIKPLRSIYKDNALYHHPGDYLGLKNNILTYINNNELRESHIYANKELAQDYDVLKIKKLLREIYEKSLNEGKRNEPR